MRAYIFSSIALLASCVQYRTTSISADDLTDEAPARPTDRVRLVVPRGETSPWIAAPRWRASEDQVCATTDRRVAEDVRSVRIWRLDDRALPGVLHGLPEPIEITVDTDHRVLFARGDHDLTPWIRDPAHREPDATTPRYQLELAGTGWTRPMRWTELASLLDRPATVGWSRSEIVRVEVAREDRGASALSTVLALAIVVPLVAVPAFAPAFSQPGDEPLAPPPRHDAARSSPGGAPDPTWQATPCDPLATYTLLVSSPARRRPARP